MAGQSRRTRVDVDSRAFQRGLEKALAKFEISCEEQLLPTGHRLRNAAVKYTPVDTGVLRSGWNVEAGRDSKGAYVEVSNHVEYAADVELGGDPDGPRADVPPQPMIRPALAEVVGVQGVGYDVVRRT